MTVSKEYHRGFSHGWLLMSSVSFVGYVALDLWFHGWIWRFLREVLYFTGV